MDSSMSIPSTEIKRLSSKFNDNFQGVSSERMTNVVINQISRLFFVHLDHFDVDSLNRKAFIKKANNVSTTCFRCINRENITVSHM